jgi:hypothetical protein
MRDIREDLRERANLLEEQIKAAQAQFEKYLEQLKSEHGTRVKDLGTELDAIKTLMGIEHRRLAGAPSASNGQPQPQKTKAQPTVPNENPMRVAVMDVIGMRRAV